MLITYCVKFGSVTVFAGLRRNRMHCISDGQHFPLFLNLLSLVSSSRVNTQTVTLTDTCRENHCPLEA